MERICEYCKGSFVPKRVDMLYCTHSCRQLAYVLRKAKANAVMGGLKMGKEEPETSISGQNNQETSISRKLVKDNISISRELITGNPSIENEANQKDSSTENKIVTYKEPDPSIIRQSENGHPSIKDAKASSELTDKDQKPSTTKEITFNKELVNDINAVNTLVRRHAKEEKYIEYSSLLLNGIVELTEERSHLGTLYSFLHNRKESFAYWISLRYRCLLECLLTLSEMQSVELEDLKEICNALTDVIQSRPFQCMIQEYPYIKEIPWLRDIIKNLCLNAEEEILTFRLKKETKLKLIAARWELSNYVPKVGFDKLNFRE